MVVGEIKKTGFNIEGCGLLTKCPFKNRHSSVNSDYVENVR